MLLGGGYEDASPEIIVILGEELDGGVLLAGWRTGPLTLAERLGKDILFLNAPRKKEDSGCCFGFLLTPTTGVGLQN